MGMLARAVPHFPQCFPQSAGCLGQKKKTPRKRSQVNRNKGFVRFYSTVIGARPGTGLDNPRPSEQPNRKQEQSANKSENSVNSDSYNPKRQR